MSWAAELALAQKAARAGGKWLRAAAKREREVLSAVGKDVKLRADQEAEKAILETLAETDLPILSEECGERGPVGDSPAWIVDPLDGSLNFLRGIPACCVSVGLWDGAHPAVGVIYDFLRDEMFAGAVNEGARCNQETIRVSSMARADQAVLSTGFPSAREFDQASLLEFIHRVRRFKKVRLPGSAALSLAYVACGRFDAYAEEDIQFWDVAAGLALVRAAGGWFSMEPSPRMKWGRMVHAAANKELWDSVEGERN